MGFGKPPNENQAGAGSGRSGHSGQVELREGKSAQRVAAAGRHGQAVKRISGKDGNLRPQAYRRYVTKGSCLISRQGQPQRPDGQPVVSILEVPSDDESRGDERTYVDTEPTIILSAAALSGLSKSAALPDIPADERRQKRPGSAQQESMDAGMEDRSAKEHAASHLSATAMLAAAGRTFAEPHQQPQSAEASTQNIHRSPIFHRMNISSIERI